MYIFSGGRTTLITIVFLLLFCMSFAANSHALEPGSKAPDFVLPGVQNTIKFSQFAGSVVYVDFWASWSGPCRQSFPWMNAMQEKYRTQGFYVIGINVDGKSDDAKRFLAQNPAIFTIAFDLNTITSIKFGVKSMPTSYLIGRDGIIISKYLGFNMADREIRENQIRTAIAVVKNTAPVSINPQTINQPKISPPKNLKQK